MNASASSALELVPPRLTRSIIALAGAPWLGVGALLLLGLAIRLLNVGGAPFDFHAMRQYRSFVIARSFYVDLAPGIPDWQRELAHLSQRNQGMLEPPLMEMLVALGWRIMGSESLWLPAVISSSVWVIGGLALFAIISRLSDRMTATLGLAFYLFLPFAVVASRSFQPDPTMVVLVLLSIWLLLRHDAAPSGDRLAAAAAMSAVAFVVHPRSVPAIALVFLALAYHRHGRDLEGWRRELLLYGPLAAVPLAVVYGYGVLTGAFRTDIAQDIFAPQFWMQPFFWRGWLSNIGASVGLIAFFGALLGTLLLRSGAPRKLMLGLWVSYAVFGLIYTSVATDDYYHLQLVPIMAIGLAPLLALVVRGIQAARPERLAQLILWGVLFAALVVVMAEGRSRTTNVGWEREVAIREEIGSIVEHSSRTVFLSGDYGVPLEFHGLLAGSPWPLASDLEWERLAGVKVPSAAERFASTYAGAEPQYFIIEDLAELERQPDLQAFLTDTFRVVASTDDYLIFDLRHGADASGTPH